MAQRRYSKRVTVTVYEQAPGDPDSVEIAEQRWARVPHLVAFHDVGPFPMSRDMYAMLDASVASSVSWLFEDLTDGAIRRIL